MGHSIYFDNCLREIRQGVYGRDMRKPIADAIEQIKKISTEDRHRILNVEAILNPNIIDWIDTVPYTIYLNFELESADTTGITIVSVSGNDYRVEDSRSEDVVELISDQQNNYRITFGDAKWDLSELEEGSRVEYAYIPHLESYSLTLTQA